MADSNPPASDLPNIDRNSKRASISRSPSEEGAISPAPASASQAKPMPPVKPQRERELFPDSVPNPASSFSHNTPSTSTAATAAAAASSSTNNHNSHGKIVRDRYKPPNLAEKEEGKQKPNHDHDQQTRASATSTSQLKTNQSTSKVDDSKSTNHRDGDGDGGSGHHHRRRSRSKERESKSHRGDKKDHHRDRSKEREKNKDRERNGSGKSPSKNRDDDDDDDRQHRKSSHSKGGSSSRKDREKESKHSSSSRRRETSEERSIRKEKEKEKDREKAKDKGDRSRDKDRERERDRDRDRDRGRDRGKDRDRDRESRKRSLSRDRGKGKEQDTSSSSKRRRSSSRDRDNLDRSFNLNEKDDGESGESGEYELEEGEDVEDSSPSKNQKTNGATSVKSTSNSDHRKKSTTPATDNTGLKQSERSARRSGGTFDPATIRPEQKPLASLSRGPKKYDSYPSKERDRAGDEVLTSSLATSRDPIRSESGRSRSRNADDETASRYVPDPREDYQDRDSSFYRNYRDRDSRAYNYRDPDYYAYESGRRDWRRERDDDYAYGASSTYLDADNPRFDGRIDRRKPGGDLRRDRDRSRSPIGSGVPDYDRDIPSGPRFKSNYQSGRDRSPDKRFSNGFSGGRTSSHAPKKSMDSPPGARTRTDSPPPRALKRKEDPPAEVKERLKSLGESSVGSGNYDSKSFNTATTATAIPEQPSSTKVEPANGNRALNRDRNRAEGDDGDAMEIDSGGEDYSNSNTHSTSIPTGPSAAHPALGSHDQSRWNGYGSSSSSSDHQQSSSGFGRSFAPSHQPSDYSSGPPNPPAGPLNRWGQPQSQFNQPLYNGPPPPHHYQPSQYPPPQGFPAPNPLSNQPPAPPPIYNAPVPSAPPSASGPTQVPGSSFAASSSSAAIPPPPRFPPSSIITPQSSKPRMKPRSSDFVPGPIRRKNRPSPPPLSSREFWGCSKFSEYEVGQKLGQGTFGMVMKARHKRTGIEVALKKVTIHQERDGMPITALREVKLLKKLNHPSIVPVLDMAYSGKDFITGKNGEMYMVEPYMDHDLFGMLENPNIILQGSQIKLYMKQLLEGTLYMHKNKILHRDMKAANLLINNEGQLQIADFGLARPYYDPGEAWKAKGWKGGHFPYTAMVVTRWYRPPELLAGEKKYGPPVDMWGLGCILGEMVSRQPIFKGTSEVDQMRLISEMCGSPNENNFPGWNQLVGVKNADPNGLPDKNPEQPGQKDYGFHRRRVKEFFMNPGGLSVNPQCADLIDKLLILDPRQRMTAQEALEHPYFWTRPFAADPSSLPKYEASKEIDKVDRNRQAHHHQQQQQHQFQQQQQQRNHHQQHQHQHQPNAHYNPGGPAHPQFRGPIHIGFNPPQQGGASGFQSSSQNRYQPPSNPYQSNGFPPPPLPHQQMGMQGGGNFHPSFSGSRPSQGFPQPQPQAQAQARPAPNHPTLPPKPSTGFPR